MGFLTPCSTSCLLGVGQIICDNSSDFAVLHKKCSNSVEDRVSCPMIIVLLGFDQFSLLYYLGNVMHFAGGSTILYNRSRSTQMKPKVHESFHGHLKKVIEVVGGQFTHMLYKYMVTLSPLLIALGKP